MDSQEKANKLLVLFKSLREILIEESENNWLRGINLIIDALTPPLSIEHDVGEALRYVESTYKSMLGGSGSFSDYYIWHDDFDKRAKANHRLEKVKDEIWDAFD